MAAIEYRVLSHVLREGSLAEAISAGLEEICFKDPEARQIYHWLLQHWTGQRTYKTLPTIAAVRRRYPSFQLTAEDPEEDGQLVALIEELRYLAFDSDIRSLANQFFELVETDDLVEAITQMRSGLEEVAKRLDENSPIGASEIAEKAKDYYDLAKQGSLYGIPWPWPALTEDTMGKRPGDFVVFYGRMKSMKTWVMLFCAAVDYLVHNCRVLIWSREMNEGKMIPRLASLLASVDYQMFKKGKLPPKLERRTMEALAELQSWRNMDPEEREKMARHGNREIILLCGRRAPKNLTTLQNLIEQHQPDVVYLDSFYHLESDHTRSTQRWARLAALAEDVKEMAEETMVPVVAVHQASRFGEKTHGNTMADMADSDVIAREADLIIRVIKRRGKELYEEGYEVGKGEPTAEETVEVTPPKPKPKAPLLKIPAKVSAKVSERFQVAKSQKEVDIPSKVDRATEVAAEHSASVDRARVGAELALVLPGNREGVMEAFTIHAIPGYNFSVIRSDISTDDVRKWVEIDDGGDSKGPRRGKRAPQDSLPDRSQDRDKTVGKLKGLKEQALKKARGEG